MSNFDPDEHPHTRYNPLKDEWVLISPHRMKRPWAGQVEKPVAAETKRHDPANPLCPNAIRPNGVQNPDYKDCFVFDNDFPALFEYDLLEQEEEEEEENETTSVKNDLFKIKPVKGKCKVMCFHPYSDLTLSTMETSDIVKVISKWCDEFVSLRQTYEWVQIFENKGAIMGCSNPHPHCQIWASSFLPSDVKTKHRTQADFYRKHNHSKIMLVEYLNTELETKSRIVTQNSHWAVLVPYWAVWPYETMLLPKRHIIRLSDITNEEKETLADILKRLLIKYDNLFQCSFPYSMGFHFAPTGKYLNEDCNFWQLHACFMPPLLRSATVKKFMVGYELLAQAQRDLTPEKAAEQLRQLSEEKHYLNN